jgi:hypothetical protein
VIWGYVNSEGMAMAQLENPLGVENGLIEPNLEAYLLKGFYTAKTMVWVHWGVPMRVLNAAH